jgi:hypothetical protein
MMMVYPFLNRMVLVRIAERYLHETRSGSEKSHDEILSKFLDAILKNNDLYATPSL